MSRPVSTATTPGMASARWCRSLMIRAEAMPARLILANSMPGIHVVDVFGLAQPMEPGVGRVARWRTAGRLLTRLGNQDFDRKRTSGAGAGARSIVRVPSGLLFRRLPASCPCVDSPTRRLRSGPPSSRGCGGLIASIILVYPVHRHRLPASASRISCSVGSGFSSSSAFADMITPGPQNPHCSEPFSSNSLLHRVQPLLVASPSMVSTSRPSACPASIRHELTAFAVDDHRAGAAVADVATELRARETELVAQHPEKGGLGATGAVRASPLTVA